MSWNLNYYTFKKFNQLPFSWFYLNTFKMLRVKGYFLICCLNSPDPDLWPWHFYFLTKTDIHVLFSDQHRYTPSTFWPTQIYTFYSLTNTDIHLLLSDQHRYTPFTLWPIQIYTFYSLTNTDINILLSDQHRYTPSTLWPTHIQIRITNKAKIR